MLLTSSQASVLISTVIIFSCTFALFLSGYVIQQRTVSQLRAAIRQSELRPSPKPYLPDRFRTTTTELEDGTIVVMESEAEAESNERKPAMVQVKQSEPQKQQVLMDDAKGESFPFGSDAVGLNVGSSFENDGKQPSEQNERNQNLGERMQGNEQNPSPEAENQKPMSRAERRRMIREEIQRLSQMDEPLYYQRRLY